MNRTTMNLIIVFGMTILLAGCGSSTGNTKLAKMERQHVEQMIVKGKTRSDEIRVALGEPNDIDVDERGNKKWIYSHTKSNLKAQGYIPYVNLISTGTNDTTKKLIICFDKQDRVIDYIVTQNKGETKLGLIH